MGNLGSSLKYLKDNRVKRGDSPESAARSERMNALTDAILSLARGEHMRRGPGIRIRTSEGMVVISGNPKSEDGGGDTSNITFAISDASTTEGDVIVNKVQVADGKINGQFPSGMGTGEDYILNLADPADSLIYAAIGFDTMTLEITSRTLGVSSAATFPASTLDETDGFFATLLGFTYVDDDGSLVVINTHLGDINFELIYGAFNGAPALLPVARYASWIRLPDELLT